MNRVLLQRTKEQLHRDQTLGNNNKDAMFVHKSCYIFSPKDNIIDFRKYSLIYASEHFQVTLTFKLESVLEISGTSSASRHVFTIHWTQFTTRAGLFERWITLSTGQIAIQRIVWFVLSTLIHWIAIYPVDSVIQTLNNRGLIF